MENVVGLTSMDGGKTLEKIFKNICDLGYKSNEKNIILNAKYFGVPQNRNRIFLLFIKDTINSTPTLPNGNLFNEELTLWVAITDDCECFDAGGVFTKSAYEHFMADDYIWTAADDTYFYYAWCDRSDSFGAGVQSRPDANVRFAKIKY